MASGSGTLVSLEVESSLFMTNRDGARGNGERLPVSPQDTAPGWPRPGNPGGRGERSCRMGLAAASATGLGGNGGFGIIPRKAGVLEFPVRLSAPRQRKCGN